MAFRRRSFRRFSGTRRRKLVWARFDESFAAAASGRTDVFSDFRVALGAALPGPTIMRIRFGLQWQWPANVALSSNSGIAAGLYIDEVGGPGSSLPLTNPNSDWLYWEWIPHAHNSNSIVTATSDVDRIAAKTIDAKGRRRMQEINQSIFFCWEATGTTAMVVNLRGSILVALP